MSRSFCWGQTFLCLLGAMGLLAVEAGAQTLRFDSHRDLVVPDNANVRLGNFYSDVSFGQSAGVRYTRSNGEGAQYLYDNHLGRVRDDGVEFPLVSSLSLHNYLLISKYMDLDLSVNVNYSYFPNKTEDDQWDVNMATEGLSARLGAFTLNMTRDEVNGNFNGRNVSAGGFTRSNSDKGFSSTISTEFDLTDFIKGRVYDSPSYTVDYVDDRGRIDELRGRKYRYFQNRLGLDMDWLMAKNKNMSYSFARTDTKPMDNGFDQTKSTETKHSLVYQQQINPVLMAGARAELIWRTFDKAYRGSQFQQDYLGFLGADLSDDTTLEAGGGHSSARLTDAGAYEKDGTSDAMVGYVKLTQRTAHAVGYSRRQDGGFDAGLEIVDEYRYAITWHNDLWSWSFVSLYDQVQPRLADISDYTDWMNQMGVTRVLTRNLSAVLNGAYTVRDNSAPAKEDLYADQPYMANGYDTWAVNFGLTQHITDSLSAFYYAEHLNQSGAGPKMDFDRDTVGVTLTYRHDF